MQMPVTASPPWDPRTKRTIALLLLGGIIALLWLLREILPIVVISALLAFVLNPLVTFLSRRVLILPFFGVGSKRGCASVIAFILVVFVIIVFLLVLVPVLVEQVEEFAVSIPSRLTTLERDLELILSEPILFNGEPILLDGQPLIPLERIAEATGTADIRQIIQFGDIDVMAALSGVISSVPSLTGPAFSIFGGAFTTVINITFLIMLTFYLLKDGIYFVPRLLLFVPDSYLGDAKRVLSDLNRVWNAYIIGQLILCLVMGLAVYIAALVIGLPYAPILGLLMCVLEFIPNIGPFIALIPAAFLGLASQSITFPFLEGFPFMLVVIIVWTGLQNVEALILVPRIMGGSLNLHPYVVMVAVLSGAALAGPLGVILAAPSVASARVLFTYLYGKLTGVSPFLEPLPNLADQPGVLTKLAKRLFSAIKERFSRKPAVTTSSKATDSQ